LSGNNIYTSPNATLDLIYKPMPNYSFRIIVRSNGNYNPGTIGRLTILTNGAFQIHRDASNSQNWSGNSNNGWDYKLHLSSFAHSKVKGFMWLWCSHALPASTRLRGKDANTACPHCGEVEDIRHMTYNCMVAAYIRDIVFTSGIVTAHPGTPSFFSGSAC
jgi:hypothetical protein